MIAWNNGELSSSVSIEDRGLGYGDGFFTTALLKKGEFVLKDYHIDRLVDSAKRLSINFKTENFEDSLLEFLSCAEKEYFSSGLEENNLILKVIVSRKGEKRGYLSEGSSSPNLYFLLYELSQEYSDKLKLKRQEGLRITIADKKLGINPMLGGIKHLNRLENVMIASSPGLRGFDEALVFDLNDRLIEAVSMNVFLIFKEGNGKVKLRTPVLDTAGVEGVMKRYVVNELEKEGVEVEECHLGLDDVLKSQALIMTNSISGVCKVSSIEGYEWRCDDALVEAIFEAVELEPVLL